LKDIGVAKFKAITRRVAIGSFLGLAWGASLRAWMALLALKFGERPQFTGEGTFGAILLPTALVGAMLGGAAYVAETSGSKRWRWATLLPLLLVLGPAIVTDDFLSILVTTGMGGGAIGVALIGMLGGYAFSGYGVQWTRWVSGLLSLFFILGSVYGFYIAAGSAYSARCCLFCSWHCLSPGLVPLLDMGPVNTTHPDPPGLDPH
jgi:hypothetical protein